MLLISPAPTRTVSVQFNARDRKIQDVYCVDVAWDPTGEVLAVAMRGVGVQIFAKPAKPVPHLLEVHGTYLDGEPMVQRWSSAGQLAVGMADGRFAVFDSRTFKWTGMPLDGAGGHRTAITAADWEPIAVPPHTVPGLAFGSISNIKVPNDNAREPPALSKCSAEPICAQVSHGSKTGEWTSTAMKAKPVMVGTPGGGSLIFKSTAASGPPVSPASGQLSRRLSFGRGRSSYANLGAGVEEDSLGLHNLEVLELVISPSGDYLAALVQPIRTQTASKSTHEMLLDIASVQQVERPKSSVLVYKVTEKYLEPLANRHAKDDEGAPIGLFWQSREALCVYTTSRYRRVATDVPWGGDVVFSFCPAEQQPAARWPAPGAQSPGFLVGAATTASGLIAAAFRRQELPGGGGSVKLLLLTKPQSRLQLQLLRTLPLDRPPASISLSAERAEGTEFQRNLVAPSLTGLIIVSFEGGGIKVSRVEPTQP